VKGPTAADIWLIDMQAGKLAPLIATDATEGGAQISPDQRWLAYYSSTGSGSSEVFVQAFPSAAGKWQVSTEGGALPRWSPDGKELFFLSLDSKVTAASIGSGDAIQLGRPAALFDAHPKGGAPFDVMPDGKRFLTNTLVQENVTQPLTIVQNWTAGLR
jgi:hypothetical protein